MKAVKIWQHWADFEFNQRPSAERRNKCRRFHKKHTHTWSENECKTDASHSADRLENTKRWENSFCKNSVHLSSKRKDLLTLRQGQMKLWLNLAETLYVDFSFYFVTSLHMVVSGVPRSPATPFLCITQVGTGTQTCLTWPLSLYRSSSLMSACDSWRCHIPQLRCSCKGTFLLCFLLTAVHYRLIKGSLHKEISPAQAMTSC